MRHIIFITILTKSSCRPLAHQRGLEVINRPNLYVMASEPSVQYVQLSCAETSVAGSELVLEAFGLDPPAKNLTVEFVQVIEQRLALQTLQALSGHLWRNPTARVAAADLEVFTGTTPTGASGGSSTMARPSASRCLALPPYLGHDVGAVLAVAKSHLLLVRWPRRARRGRGQWQRPAMP